MNYFRLHTNGRNSRMNRKSQTWSVDAMISVMVFIIGIVVILYFILYNSGQDAIRELKMESELIPLKVMASGINSATELSFIVNGRVDKERMKEVAAMDYSELKSKLGVKNDFCMYFEDANGNLIQISDDIDKDSSIMGIGNPSFGISGKHCGDDY